VNFLVDNQLPETLGRFLNDHGHQACHVLDLEMDEASDLGIWNYAAANDWIVVSKDEDFLHLANRPGDAGKLLWVRTGNCLKPVLMETFRKNLPGIIQAFAEGFRVVEIR